MRLWRTNISFMSTHKLWFSFAFPFPVSLSGKPKDIPEMLQIISQFTPKPFSWVCHCPGWERLLWSEGNRAAFGLFPACSMLTASVELPKLWSLCAGALLNCSLEPTESKTSKGLNLCYSASHNVKISKEVIIFQRFYLPQPWQGITSNILL